MYVWKNGNDMTYKKNDIVRFISNQPAAHVIRMFGHYQGLKPEDATPDEYLGRVKSVIGDGRAYVVSTLSPLKGFICIVNADEIHGRVELAGLSESEKQAYYDRPESHEAPNVYDNDPSSLDPSLNLKEKCETVAAKAMSALFPEARITGFSSFGIYNYRMEKYISDLDYCLASAGTKSKRKLAALKKKRDELESWFRQMRFKEYYTICADIEESATTTRFWLVAIDLNFEEVSIMRDGAERGRFRMFLGCEHDQLLDAKIDFAYESIG